MIHVNAGSAKSQPIYFYIFKISLTVFVFYCRITDTPVLGWLCRWRLPWVLSVNPLARVLRLIDSPLYLLVFAVKRYISPRGIFRICCHLCTGERNLTKIRSSIPRKSAGAASYRKAATKGKEWGLAVAMGKADRSQNIKSSCGFLIDNSFQLFAHWLE